MRCIECEEIELARVRDAAARARRSRSRTPRCDGFPAGRAPYDLTRRRLLQWGVAGLGVGLRRQAARLRGGLGVGRGGRRGRPDGQVPGAALPGGRQRRPERRPAQRQRRLRRVRHGPAVASRAPRRDAQGRRRRATARDRLAARWPVPAGPRSRSPASRSPSGRRRQRDRRFNFTAGGEAFGFDTLYGDGTGGPGSNLAVMPAVDAKKYSLSHFDNSDIWFAASNDINVKTGWLGRWIDRNGSPTNPLQAISIDTALSKSIRTAVNPVCAINVAADGRLHGGHLEQLRRRERPPTPNPAVDSARAAPGRRGQRVPGALARHLRARVHDLQRRQGLRRRARPIRPTRTRARSRRGCGSPRTCSRPTSARGSSRSTGAASTPTRTSWPARTSSSPSSRARSAPSRPT